MNFEQIIYLTILFLSLGGGLFLIMTSRISDKQCRDFIHSVYSKRIRKNRKIDEKMMAA